MCPGRMPELPEVEIARRNLSRWLQGHRVVRAAGGRHPRLPRRQTCEIRRADRARRGPGPPGQVPAAHLRGRAGPAGPPGDDRQVRPPPRGPRRALQPRPPPPGRRHCHPLQGLPPLRPHGARPRRQAAPAQGHPGAGPGSAGGRAHRGAAPGGARPHPAGPEGGADGPGRRRGPGNIHAAEALFRSRLHPARKPAVARPEEWNRGAPAIHRRSSPPWRRSSRRRWSTWRSPGRRTPSSSTARAGNPCPRCGTTVQLLHAGGPDHATSVPEVPAAAKQREER